MKASLEWFFNAAQPALRSRATFATSGPTWPKSRCATSKTPATAEKISRASTARTAARRYGLTAATMEPPANTVLYAMRQPDGKFAGRVDGTAGKHPPGGLRGNWLDLCEFAPELFAMLYQINRGRIPSSPDIAAGILWHRERRAEPAERQPATAGLRQAPP